MPVKSAIIAISGSSSISVKARLWEVWWRIPRGLVTGRECANTVLPAVDLRKSAGLELLSNRREIIGVSPCEGLQIIEHATLAGAQTDRRGGGDSADPDDKHPSRVRQTGAPSSVAQSGFRFLKEVF
jgi:hypothetical protein